MIGRRLCKLCSGKNERCIDLKYYSRAKTCIRQPAVINLHASVDEALSWGFAEQGRKGILFQGNREQKTNFEGNKDNIGEQGI